MNIQPYKESSILISATKDQVWDTLVNPAKTMQYMYGCRIESDWEIGSEVKWIGDADQVLYVTGKLLKYLKNDCLVYSVVEPNPNYSTEIHNHLKVQCTLTKLESGIRLQVIQGDFTSVAEGERRYGHTDDSWDSILVQIKEITEAS